jgi:uncharacterized protein YyaL (SSP411 family)
LNVANRLGHETSPYLLQHADNPVDWYPWGAEALARAKSERKPILLSIGYSACHWCHVMAHESFEDAEVAALMNDLYVNIKVDREERPDLDQIYQAAHALLTRRGGGWPLTMFLTPEQQPFFGGTYFPKTSRYGMPGFLDLLPRVAAAYREQGSEIAEQSKRLTQALDAMRPDPAPPGAALPAHAIDAAWAEMLGTFDRVYGGFGGAPKFPRPPDLDFCLRRYATTGDALALDVVRLTLSRMAQGGICDQLAGGFFRYSVDAEWTIPHFEKMLYDNALLLSLYVDAWRATGEPSFARAARGIVQWALVEMLTGDGAFCSSLDADSEHEEGKFYVWRANEVRSLLSDDEYAVAARHWGLEGPPNFEHSAWHLRIVVGLETVARELGIDIALAQDRLDAARATLLAARATRVRPDRDDKVLTSWNALMIRALARAARVFDEPAWLARAQQALGFLRSTLWQDGRLLATSKGGNAHLNAYLDDHAYLLAALVESLQTRFHRQDLDWAIAIAETLLARFEDASGGGFYFTSHDHETLIHRGKPGHDNATPAGNGIAAQALFTLGHWLSEARYVDAAERTVRAFAHDLGAQPSGFSSLLVALADALHPPTTVLLQGDGATCAAWQRALESRYRPALRTLDVSGEDALPAALAKPHALTSVAATAWVCTGATCLPPLASLDAIEAALGQRVPAAQ